MLRTACCVDADEEGYSYTRDELRVSIRTERREARGGHEWCSCMFEAIDGDHEIQISTKTAVTCIRRLESEMARLASPPEGGIQFRAVRFFDLGRRTRYPSEVEMRCP